MSQSSEAKIAANRKNGLLSTGPKTKEGKDRSRANALKHGMCALVVDIPGEDPEALQVRFEEWNAELNPNDRAAQSYLILRAVKRSRRLDRLDTSHEARVAQSVRDAHVKAREAKLRDIDTYSHMIEEEPCNVGVRRLMLTAEGCEWLINEWNLIRPALEPSMHWDGADEVRINRIAGNSSVMKKITPSPYALATIAITAYREVATRIKDNEFPEGVAWEKRYKSTNWKERDLEKIGPLYEKAEPYRLWLIKEIDDKVAKLTALKLEHEAADARHAAEVPFRAIFDATDEGKLIHRYEMDAERSLLRCLKEVRDLNKVDAVVPQTLASASVTPIKAPSALPRSTTKPARNEPTARGRDEMFGGLISPLDRPEVDVPLNITPENWSKQQR